MWTEMEYLRSNCCCCARICCWWCLGEFGAASETLRFKLLIGDNVDVTCCLFRAACWTNSWEDGLGVWWSLIGGEGSILVRSIMSDSLSILLFDWLMDTYKIWWSMNFVLVWLLQIFGATSKRYFATLSWMAFKLVTGAQLRIYQITFHNIFLQELVQDFATFVDDG